MFRMIASAVLMLGPISSEAWAQNCRQMPAGPARFECAMKNPAFAAKLERCQDEGRKMGLSNQRSASAGGLKPYVKACMSR